MSTNPSLVVDGRYELAERIGTGGFSEVWLAHDQVLGRPVAVKLLHEAYARHPESLLRFRAEARHAGSISHQNIARIYDYGDPDPARLAELAYLVMEYIDGPSLAEVLRTGNPLDAAACLDIVAQTAAGLQAAHAAGLVHRDIKPANLLLSPDSVVKITDFGISHAVGSAPLTSTGVIIGTPGYLAPERAAGAQATYLSDLYALGVVAYECLAGKHPFSGTPLEVALAHKDRPFPALPESVPAEVTTLVGQLIAKDPAERPASAGEVAERAGDLRQRLSEGEAGSPGAASADRGELGLGELGPGVLGPGALGLGAPGPGATRRMTAPRGWQAGGARAGGSPAGRWREAGGRRRWAAVAGLVAAAGLAALVITGLVTAMTGGGTVRQPHRAAPAVATKIDVDASALIGQPVSTVARQLRREGLSVRVRWRPSEHERPGYVLRVQPAGHLPPRSSVTVVGATISEFPGGDDHRDGGRGHHGNGHDGGDGDGGNGHGHGGDGGNGNSDHSNAGHSDGVVGNGDGVGRDSNGKGRPTWHLRYGNHGAVGSD